MREFTKVLIFVKQFLYFLSLFYSYVIVNAIPILVKVQVSKKCMIWNTSLLMQSCNIFYFHFLDLKQCLLSLLHEI